MKKSKARKLWRELLHSDCYESGPPLMHSSYEDRDKWRAKCNACPDKKSCHKRQWDRIEWKGESNGSEV